jgi:hypothetical protein
VERNILPTITQREKYIVKVLQLSKVERLEITWVGVKSKNIDLMKVHHFNLKYILIRTIYNEMRGQLISDFIQVMYPVLFISLAAVSS